MGRTTKDVRAGLPGWLVAARNEAERIQETIAYVAAQDYPGPIEVLVVDNGSTDRTRAVRQLVARLLSAPPDVQAVAGSVLVRNSRDNLWTRMQEWDYFLLTWQLMRQGARVYDEPSAVAFTAAPARLVHLARQRARWARGMVEGLRSVKPWNQPRGLLRSSPRSTC